MDIRVTSAMPTASDLWYFMIFPLLKVKTPLGRISLSIITDTKAKG
jgi:hypothetical protein